MANTCYPEDDPARAGTGPEDAADPRPDGDVGEEYITSDVWTDFDDEGNAYAMVLDSPVFPSGAGWGMSFHRWETPSAADVASGQTWTKRVPINAYPSLPAQATTLDDKNTFAINNAGPDHDGKTGIIVACWGQNFDLANLGRQATVCERSLDGGRTWPDAPQPISPPQDPPLPFGPFVIGVHVVADRDDPNTFYAVWLDTLTGFLDGTGKSPFWFTKTTDGAQTWEPAKIIARIDQLPNTFPLQGFRNLSLPIMDAGPDKSLYVTYADYNRAPLPGDEDRQQADIKLLRSFDGGARWFPPTRVNRNRTTPTSSSPTFASRRAARWTSATSTAGSTAHPGSSWATSSSTPGCRGPTTAAGRGPRSACPTTPGTRRSIRRSQGLASSSVTTRGSWRTTATRSRLSTTPTWPIRRAATQASTRASPRSPFQQIVAWRVPNSREFFGGNNARRTRACAAADPRAAR